MIVCGILWVSQKPKETNMQTQEIPEAIKTAAASMLAPYCHGLTPSKLESAIGFEFDDKQPEKLRTRKETKKALHVSMPTVDRMLSSGELTRVTVRGRVFIRQSEIDRIITGAVA